MFYIMMVNDHMKRFGDLELVRNHIACVDGIPNYFDRHLTDKGLVGSVGGVLFHHKYWSFIDWTEEWNDNIGVSLAANYGDKSITMESLLYVYGLKRVAELAEALGRDSTAKEYRMRAENVAEAVMRYCRDERGLIADDPGHKLYSTHCQVWAILDDLVDVEEGRKMLEATYGKTGVPQCSVSMSFYLFLAFEKLGMLDMDIADSMWNPWRKMLKDNMTTCVENTTDGRSDCHAWGSLMLYALPRIIKAKSLSRESVENESKI